MKRFNKLRKLARAKANELGHELGYFTNFKILKKENKIIKFGGRAYCLKCLAYMEIDTIKNNISGTIIKPCF